MKNLFKVFGVIALVVVIGFSMAACNTDGDDKGGTGTILAGTTWTYKDIFDNTFTLTFTATTVRLEYPGGTINGTYTLNGSSGSIIWNDGTNDSFVVNGNTLTVIGNDTNLIFVKGTGGGTPTTYSINGVWENANGNRVTVTGSTGVLSNYNFNDATWNDAINKGYVSIGSQIWRNLTGTGNLTWSGQNLKVQFYTSSPNVAIGTNWGNATFTMSANGQTLTVSGDSTTTWTRVSTYSINGVWENANGNRVTVTGSTGVLSNYNFNDATWNDAINKGYVSIGSQIWRNLTSTGNLTWSGQNLKVQFYTSSPNVAIGTNWGNATFTMSANGQTLTVSGDSTTTWTRVQ